MRYRDIASILLTATGTVLMGIYGFSMLKSIMLDSDEVNRDDARRVASTLLSQDRWVEFPVLRDATNLRLLTNAALESTDAPDHDLTNPRLGWRYSVDYEMYDAVGELVVKSRYNFRSQIRQLLNVESGQQIYPIFLGKNGLVSAQTRMMQLSLDQFERRPTMIRLKLSTVDPGIQEVTARLLSRLQRADYDKRFTWNRLSHERREAICRYCVYEPDLLTINERHNLLRWRWARTPALAGDENRHLYFIGDVDDHEVRDEQLPQGTLADPHWPATFPVPEGAGRVRLEIDPVDEQRTAPADLTIRWFGIRHQDRTTTTHTIETALSQTQVRTDGGLIQIDSPRRVVVRAFWSAEKEASSDHDADELEITADALLVRTFIVDQDPLEYAISHHADQPTQLRISFRYPYGVHFGNPAFRAQADAVSASAAWEFLDADNRIVKSGTTTFQPQVSHYDNLQLYGQNEYLSEKHDLFFRVPAGVRRLRIRSADNRLLASVAVRPSELPGARQIPEDYEPFHARESINRTWYGLNPPQQHALVQNNRSFIARVSHRPPEDTNEQILAGDYQWRRFVPGGQWVGRQMLVPLDDELEVTSSASNYVYHELTAGKVHQFAQTQRGSTNDQRVRILWMASDAPGTIAVRINNELVHSERVDSARGELNLADLQVPDQGHISITSDRPARFFFCGRTTEHTTKYLKRTTQRLSQGQLEFEFTKESDEEELLTIQLYRRSGETQRAKLRVAIAAASGSMDKDDLVPAENWTVRDRIYDLRPLSATAPGPRTSLLLGSQDHVDRGERLFVLLGKDLKRGVYRIRVRRVDNVKDGYVLMYQTIPGTQKTRKIRIQTRKPGQHER